MSTTVEWSYWPQWRRYTLTSTTPRKLGEDLVQQVELTPAQARRFARMVLEHKEAP